MTHDLYPFRLEDGPQRRDPGAPETWQRTLDELAEKRERETREAGE